MIRLVTVGPFPIFFGNVNAAMNLRGHHHTAQVVLEYGHHQGDHGYPSFLATNNAIRRRLEELTGPRRTFRDATNEDVAERLFNALCAFVDDTWIPYGGRYWLDALHLDVEGVQDDIGHDNGTTRYTIRLDQDNQRVLLPTAQQIVNHQRAQETPPLCSKGYPITVAYTDTDQRWPCGCPTTNPGTPTGGHV